MTDADIINRVRDDIIKHVDGYWYFHPTNQGAYSAHTLLVIADYLDNKNKRWNFVVDNATNKTNHGNNNRILPTRDVSHHV